VPVSTNGPIRGFLGRWVMRVEAAGGILRIGFLGVTAASTLTSALALIGLEQLAPVVLAVGCLATAVFAFAYVELGIYNRKNRERYERGSNFAGPRMRMDDEMIARSVLAGIEGRELSAEERQAIKGEADHCYHEYRDGISINK
jgi:hypothetical protein